ncbi:MAG TPA: glutaminyl-peptide cyclotransferase [Flavitalea sp.]|nr:glutaminyl-peptide cyclotransferase [Flavitalea sp.]
MNRLVPFLLVVLNCYSCNESDKNGDRTVSDNPPAPDTVPFTIVNQYPHDTLSFTEGLTVYNGQLYESTGSGNPDGHVNNGSWAGPLDLKSGKAEKKIKLDNKYFGEGMTILRDKVYFLTWTTKIGFVYDLHTFKKLDEFHYPSEGWGLTNDGTSLIMSNGSNNLAFLNTDSLQITHLISVTDNNGPVANLNELEYINGFIYANQWQTPYILKIDPGSGRVVGKMYLDNVYNDVLSKNPGSDYLNGIAYDSATQKIYITGKLWPLIYEIKFQ